MIIGLTGKKQAGKDTVAKYLQEIYDFEHVAFADLLKLSVGNLFGISREQIEEWKLNDDIKVEIIDRDDCTKTAYKTIMTFRELLQRYGTEAHRDVFGYDFWVKQLMRTLDFTKNYVISDIRFDNEAFAIKTYESGGIVRPGMLWHIHRPGVDDKDTHTSEAGIRKDYIDYYIINDHTLGNLYSAVDALMRKALGSDT